MLVLHNHNHSASASTVKEQFPGSLATWEVVNTVGCRVHLARYPPQYHPSIDLEGDAVVYSVHVQTFVGCRILWKSFLTISSKCIWPFRCLLDYVGGATDRESIFCRIPTMSWWHWCTIDIETYTYWGIDTIADSLQLIPGMHIVQLQYHKDDHSHAWCIWQEILANKHRSWSKLSMRN